MLYTMELLQLHRTLAYCILLLEIAVKVPLQRVRIKTPHVH